MDRYTKAALTVIAIALVVIAARPFLAESGLPDALRLAQAQAQVPRESREATIPKAWGKYVTYQSGNLLLEDPTARCASSTWTASRPSIPR